MALNPLDLQVVIGQMHSAGKEYSRLYTAPRKDQILHATFMEEKSRQIDNKVTDIPEEVNDYQNAHLDPHEGQNKRKDFFPKKPFQDEEEDVENPYKEHEKGTFIDVLK